MHPVEGDAVAGTLVVLDGSTFFVSDPTGNVEPGHGATGFFFKDMRHLSTWRLLVNGRPMQLLTVRTPDYYSARIFGTLGTARVGLNPTISIRRDRFVSDGVHEDIVVENNCDSEQEVRLELEFGSDFADLFEVKARELKPPATSVEIGSDRVSLRYEHEGFVRGTTIAFSLPATIDEEGVRFDLQLKPRERWQLCVDVLCLVDGTTIEPGQRCGSFGMAKPKMPMALDQWLADAPRLEADSDTVRHTYRQSLVDLAALRFRPDENVSWSLPAAGLPWFMALFGRDSLITSYQALPFQAHLAQTTLEALSAMQATRMDDFTDAEPGKILHELRCGELARLGKVPHTPYYGTHDATPLFLILLDEYERWTGDTALVHNLEPAARAALAWIERYGDLDGDGYLEHRTRSSKGLVNQGWKDSWNSMLFADGRVAEGPIAVCEVQGYAYDARLRAARLARSIWNDTGLADRLEADAALLRSRFNRDFWSESRGHYVVALDGQKHQVDALTSNIGHLLWSGIVDPERAARTVERLMAPDMFSGWGVRTMSARDAGYNPIEYHNGTVWPHDTGLIAEGMRRYGFTREAATLAISIFDAAEAFAYRLPELFAGFPREETGVAVEYPSASRPQAWSAGAPLLALRTLLGLDVVDGVLHSQPHLPSQLGRLRLEGIRVRGGQQSAG
ncbi:MAG: glycogen debranching N-terminal domain-containing protein [Candidatus Dormibacter sp.]